jgi:hypothetical protein
MTNHWSATSSMVSRASATPEGGYPQSSTVFRLGLFFPGAGSSGCPAPPGQVFCRALTAGGARSAVAASRANLPRCVDHLRGDDGLAVTQIPFVNEEASASVPRWKQGLSDAVPDVSWSWLSGCRPGARKVDTQGEVRDEAVTQVLGGKIIQRRRGQEASSDRGDVVSLLVHVLDELRERRPVSLSEESLVELVGQRGPPLLR